MDDLVNNFAGHLKKMIGKKIGEEIKNKIDVNKDHIEVESEIKKNILIYLKKANEKEINDIAKNIFNSFVERRPRNSEFLLELSARSAAEISTAREDVSAYDIGFC